MKKKNRCIFEEKIGKVSIPGDRRSYSKFKVSVYSKKYDFEGGVSFIIHGGDFETISYFPIFRSFIPLIKIKTLKKLTKLLALNIPEYIYKEKYDTSGFSFYIDEREDDSQEVVKELKKLGFPKPRIDDTFEDKEYWYDISINTAIKMTQRWKKEKNKQELNI